MNIADANGLWRITPYQIENRKTGEIKRLTTTPSAGRISGMNYASFLQKCATAFRTGIWPKTYWSSGRITD